MKAQLKLLSILALFAFSTCEKEEDRVKLPAATNSGAMTMGFVVDGKTTVAATGTYEAPAMGNIMGCRGGVEAYFFGDGISISGRNCRKMPEYQMQFVVKDSIVIGKPIQLGDYDNVAECFVYKSTTNSKFYNSTDSLQASITFTHASDSIYSGVFEGTFSDGKELISISSGRFDVRVQH